MRVFHFNPFSGFIRLLGIAVFLAAVHAGGAVAAQDKGGQELRIENVSRNYLRSFARRMGVGCNPNLTKKQKTGFDSDEKRALYYLFLVKHCGRAESQKNADFSRGKAFYKMEKMEKAADYISRAVEAGYDNPLAHLYMGKVLIKREQYDRAFESLEKAVKHADADEELKNAANKALLLAKAGKEAQEDSKDIPKAPKSEITETASKIILVPYDKKKAKKKLSEYDGKMVILHFWASWCLPCIKEFPELLDFYEEYRGQGVQLITLSLDYKHSAVKKFMKKYASGSDIPVYYDQGGRLLQKLTSYIGLPTTILFDGYGKAVKVHTGVTDWKGRELADFVENTLVAKK